MKLVRSVLSLAVLLVLGACTATSPDGSASDPEPSLTPGPSASSPFPTLTPLPTATAKPTPTLAPGVPTLPPGGMLSDGEAPASVLADITADVVERAGVEESAITVVRSQAVTWSDGSLGCPQPGMNYTQALVDGYWVVLEAEGVAYDYRATARGSFTLCS